LGNFIALVKKRRGIKPERGLSSPQKCPAASRDYFVRDGGSFGRCFRSDIDALRLLAVSRRRDVRSLDNHAHNDQLSYMKPSTLIDFALLNTASGQTYCWAK
jgi:hypothetical protein